VIGTVRIDNLGENLYQGAGGLSLENGDHETPPVEHHELPFMAEAVEKVV
jgi:hypothetical protein